MKTAKMKTKIFAIVLLSVLAVSALGAISGVMAVGGPTVTLSAPPSGLSLGSTFTITATISSDATNVWQWVITNLNWNPAVLNMSADPLMGTYLTGATLFTSAPYDNTIGNLPEVSNTKMTSAGDSGAGLLVTFTFKVVGFGTSDITMESAVVKSPDAGHPTTQCTVVNTTFNLPPPPPYGPTAVITTPADNAFLNKGTSITLDGSNSLPGFTGTAAAPITTWAWSVDLGNDGSVDNTYNSATPGSFADNTIGDTKITLTVTAPTATPTTNTKTIIVHIVAPPTGAAVDVFTQRGGQFQGAPSDAFGPQENVTIYANVTYNNVPVAQKDVSFEVRDKTNTTVVLAASNRTDANGIATYIFRLPWPDVNPDNTFGIWTIFASVDISQNITKDTCTFEFNYTMQLPSVRTVSALTGGVSKLSFARDPYPQHVYVEVTAVNIRNVAQSCIVTVTIYDEARVPIGVMNLGFNNVAAHGSQTNTFDLTIPHYAFVGQAKAYANALTGIPSAGGVPFCPEKSAQFTITVS